MRTGRVLTIAMFTLVVFASTAASRGHRYSPIGTWELDVDVEGFPPIFATVAYTASGTLTSVDSGPPPGQTMTAAVGAWKRTGKRSFAWTFQRYHFDLDGNFLFTFRLTGHAVINARGNEYKDSSVGQLIFPNGDVIDVPGGTAHAKRLIAEH